MSFKRVDIKTGYLCNCNCKFCVQAHNKKYANKDYDEIKESLVNAKKDNCSGVVFTGGEFTLRKDALSLVSFAKKLGFSTIQIQSNGRMFSNKDFCKKIIKAGANEFSPALHGYKKEIHDFLTSSSGAFEQTVQGIKNLKNMGQYIVMNSVIVKPNYRYAPQLAKLLCGLGVDQFQFAFVHAMGNALTNIESMMPYKSLAVPYLKKGIDIANSHGIFVMVEAVPFCFMEGYEKHVSEFYIPPTRIEERNRVIKDFKAEKMKGAKVKHEKCKDCKYFNICEGPWKEYPEHFGWDEFIPVKGKNINDPKEILENEENHYPRVLNLKI
ncbi:MAG: radical SAM protein [Candidatus Woesearchaeota archaeon]